MSNAEQNTQLLAGLSGTNTTVPGTAAEAGKFFENITVTNPTSVAGYGIRYSFYHHTGSMSSGSFDIADTVLARWESITTGFGFGKWLLVSSPLAVGSGYPGAPTLAQGFGIVGEEFNPQNRNSAAAWANETRLFSKWVAGHQMVGETQDFTATLGGVRVGYDIHAGYILAGSFYTSNVTNRNARFLNGMLFAPNTIAPTGYGHFMQGYRDFVVAAAVSDGGTGYTVGDVLTFDTSANAYFNLDTTVKVLTVSSGVITSVEVYTSGSYSSSFASPIGVTGGTGTGAEFTYTLSTPASEYPAAAVGVSGKWLYGIDFCPVGPGGGALLYADCITAAVRLANNQPIVARDAGNSANVTIVKVNTSDQVEIAGKAIKARASWTPTFTAASGAFTTIAATVAKWSESNGIAQFQISVLLTTKNTATGSLRFTVPTTVSATEGFACAGVNETSGVVLSCVCAIGGTYVECKTAAGGDPLVDGNTYVITGSYAVA